MAGNVEHVEEMSRINQGNLQETLLYRFSSLSLSRLPIGKSAENQQLDLCLHMHGAIALLP